VAQPVRSATMTKSLQELSDRLEIQDLLVAYSYAIDFRRWDELDDVFTPDAVIDYTETGGPRGTLAETKAFLRKAMPMFSAFQHNIATSQVILDGDTATGRTVCHNPMVIDKGTELPHVWFYGLWYRDRFARTAAGWRITERYEEASWAHNLPPHFPYPAGVKRADPA
jgi:hypothetical protein